MNKEYVQCSLRDALKEIEEAFSQIESDAEYGEGE